MSIAFSCKRALEIHALDGGTDPPESFVYRCVRKLFLGNRRTNDNSLTNATGDRHNLTQTLMIDAPQKTSQAYWPSNLHQQSQTNQISLIKSLEPRR